MTARKAVPAPTPARRPVKSAPVKRAPSPTTRLDAVAGAVEDLRKLEAQLRRLKTKHKAALAMVQDAMGEATQGTINGVPVVSWTTSMRQQIDTNMIKEKYPDVADTCVKFVRVRTFSLIEPA